jgi:hypothetical protein
LEVSVYRDDLGLHGFHGFGACFSFWVFYDCDFYDCGFRVVDFYVWGLRVAVVEGDRGGFGVVESVVLRWLKLKANRMAWEVLDTGTHLGRFAAEGRAVVIAECCTLDITRGLLFILL